MELSITAADTDTHSHHATRQEDVSPRPRKYGPPRADALEFLNALAMPDGDDIEFEPPKLDIVFRPAELD